MYVSYEKFMIGTSKSVIECGKYIWLFYVPLWMRKVCPIWYGRGPHESHPFLFYGFQHLIWTFGMSYCYPHTWLVSVVIFYVHVNYWSWGFTHSIRALEIVMVCLSKFMAYGNLLIRKISLYWIFVQNTINKLFFNF